MQRASDSIATCDTVHLVATDDFLPEGYALSRPNLVSGSVWGRSGEAY